MYESRPVILIRGSCHGEEILDEVSFATENEISDILSNHNVLREIARSVTGEDDVDILTFKNEFGTSSGSIDILAVDNKGRIYLFELKRGKKSDSEWDRKALAQLLEYAGAIYEEYSQNVEDFIMKLEADIGEDIKENLENVLETGDYFLVVVAPKIPDRLKRALSYLVTVSNGSIKLYELSVRKFGKGECQVLELLPSSTPLTPKSPETKIWTENEIMKLIESHQDEKLKERLLKLIDVIKESNMDDIGGKTKYPLIRVRLKHKDREPIIFTFNASNGNITAYLGIKGEKDSKMKELKKHIHRKLAELDLIEPDFEKVKDYICKDLKKKINELSDEEYLKLLNIVKELAAID